MDGGDKKSFKNLLDKALDELRPRKEATPQGSEVESRGMASVDGNKEEVSKSTSDFKVGTEVYYLVGERKIPVVVTRSNDPEDGEDVIYEVKDKVSGISYKEIPEKDLTKS